MAHVTIVVSFTSLLEQIVVTLDLAKPIYNCADLGNGLAFVVVPSKAGPASYLFSGMESDTLQASREDAAKKAVLFFVRNNKIRVHDVNYEKKEWLKQCRDLYMLKRHEFDCIEKGIERLDTEVVLGRKELNSYGYRICLDFLVFLREVVTKVKIQVTPIECIQYGNGYFLAWFTVFGPDGHGPVDCIIGDRKSTVVEAKQSLAMKAILCLMPMYGFVVEDVSFHQLTMEEFAIKVARESYLTVKEREHGLKEDLVPCPIVVEQDNLTPRGEKFAILTPNGPSLPPKKRKLEESSRPCLTTQPTVPYSVVNEELSMLAKQVKKQ